VDTAKAETRSIGVTRGKHSARYALLRILTQRRLIPMSEKVTMEDYLDPDGGTQDDDRADEPPTSPYPYSRGRNEHGTAQRCRWCGEGYETRGRRNYMLNRHEAECPERDTDD